MLSLTRRLPGETTRKLARNLAPRLLPMLGLLALAGCATPGANHVYVTMQADPAIHDVQTPAASLPRVVQTWERVLGLAYDYNTDHLFVRVWPRQIIRVIERPSGKILRTMPLPAALHSTAPADLAIRSRDRHLFAVHPDGHTVVELTLFGEPVREITFPTQPAAITGLAYDQRGDRLLLLAGQTILIGTLDGQIVNTVTLAAPIDSVTLAYDSDAGRYYAPLADGRTLGEFDAAGRLLSRQTLPNPAAITGLDAGPRSLVRVF